MLPGSTHTRVYPHTHVHARALSLSHTHTQLAACVDGAPYALRSAYRGDVATVRDFAADVAVVPEVTAGSSASPGEILRPS